jgi:hypothetical protein
MNLIDRLQLWSLARSWKVLAAHTGLSDPARSTYRECAQELEDVLGGESPPAAPVRTMTVTVYGFENSAMENEARAIGQQVFPGLDVTVTRIWVREPLSSEQRARAAALTVPVFDGGEPASPGHEGVVLVAEVGLMATEPDPARAPEYAGRKREPLAATENSVGGSSV